MRLSPRSSTLPRNTRNNGQNRKYRRGRGPAALSPACSWWLGVLNLRFTGKIWYWKGPAPWYFVTVPEEECLELEEVSALATYGWGMIPVTARIGRTSWKTSLFPKDGRYIVPVKAAVRTAEALEVGAMVTVRLVVDV